MSDCFKGCEKETKLPAVNAYCFQKIVLRDLDQLATWQSRPYVREWWDEDEPLVLTICRIASCCVA